MKLLINESNIVVTANANIVSDDAKHGFYIEEINTVYPFSLNLTLVDTQTVLPGDFIGGKYIYENDTFTLNPNYSEPVNVEAQLKAQQEQIEELTLQLLLMGV